MCCTNTINTTGTTCKSETAYFPELLCSPLFLGYISCLSFCSHFCSVLFTFSSFRRFFLSVFLYLWWERWHYQFTFSWSPSCYMYIFHFFNGQIFVRYVRQQSEDVIKNNYLMYHQTHMVHCMHSVSPWFCP